MNIIIYFLCTNVNIERLRLEYIPAYYRNIINGSSADAVEALFEQALHAYYIKVCLNGYFDI